MVLYMRFVDGALYCAGGYFSQLRMEMNKGLGRGGPAGPHNLLRDDVAVVGVGGGVKAEMSYISTCADSSFPVAKARTG